VNFLDSDISRVEFGHSFGVDSGLGVLEPSKIVPFSFSKGRTNHFAAFFVDNDLCFQRVPLFLAGIVEFLPLFGRSIGVSVASISTSSYAMLLFSNAFLLGSENVPSLTKTSSTHLIRRCLLLSWMP